MAFVDEAKFFVKAGDGGNGCLSFRREKFVPKGGPDGGDGGDGGSVYIEASGRLHSLLDFKYKSHFSAKSGTHGKGKKMHGRKGADFVLTVPVGSIIRDAESGEVIADLVTEGQRFLAAHGGEGGRGNVHFATAQNRAPRRATKGRPGEEFWFRIELKLLADVGLIGLPNAGKSTLLSRLSAANPKVADYPFTTIEPQLGVLFSEYGEPCIIADIPGIIEGAHAGAGLGHKFLRHIERTRILLHVIDAADPDIDPLEQYQVVRQELRQYKDSLTERNHFVVLNKIDLLEGSDRLQELLDLFAGMEVEVLGISALENEGLEALRERIFENMSRFREIEIQNHSSGSENDDGSEN